MHLTKIQVYKQEIIYTGTTWH